MQLVRRVGIAVLLLVLGCAVGLVLLLRSPIVDLPATQLPGDKPVTGLKVLFLGTSSMAWTDGESTWLVDGFFSRQVLGKVLFTSLQVEEDTVKTVASETFRRLQRPEALNGILVAHSHYDHVLDAPYLARLYGGPVIGSESTRQIALGQGLPDAQIQVPPPGSIVRLGDFRIQLLKSAHAPTGFTGGFNDSPLSLPAHALSFKEGLSFTFVVFHPSKGKQAFALIQPSAGFIPGQNDGISVDTVFLGTGGLGKLGEAYVADYWREMVVKTGARQVYLIHWDDFTQPLLPDGRDAELKPMPALLDDFSASLQVLNKFANRDNVRLQVLDAWQILDF
ncbi:MAG TPA: hypothetical protein VFV28_09220 [Limnobacter sp.]|nr:hypothetical protein [Limnobacter sp.]